MKTKLLLPAVLICSSLFSQSIVYDDFEGTKMLIYGMKNSSLDTLGKNPAPSNVNGSVKCAKYVRSADKNFDNIKMSVNKKLKDVSSFATYTGMPPKIKMKVYTTAPAGTLVEILLGSKGRNNEYPAGTHSQYQARTTKSGEWEILEFKFSQIPQGSQTPADEIDQITLLFNPNSTDANIYYFDEIAGPELISSETENAINK